MNRPTWVTVVGVLGIMRAAQTALLPQTLRWQREFMHSMASSFPAQGKGAGSEEMNQMLDSLLGPVPRWLTPWSIVAGVAGLGLSIAYLYAMIAPLSMKRGMVRLIYVSSTAP